MSTIEYNSMGFFGLSWTEKVADNAKKYLLKEQAVFINTTLVNNIHQKYLSLLLKNYKRINFIESTGDIKYRTWTGDSLNTINAIRSAINIPLIYVDSVFRALYELAINGKIPYGKLDPIQVKKDKEDTSIFNPPNIFLPDKDQLNKFSTTANLIAIAAIAVAAVILFKKRI
jgi:hypothetical protein